MSANSPFGSSSSTDDASDEADENEDDNTSFDSVEYDMVSYDLATSSFSSCPSSSTLSSIGATSFSLSNSDRRMEFGALGPYAEMEDSTASNGGYTTLATIEEGEETDGESDKTEREVLPSNSLSSSPEISKSHPDYNIASEINRNLADFPPKSPDSSADEAEHDPSSGATVSTELLSDSFTIDRSDTREDLSMNPNSSTSPRSSESEQVSVKKFEEQLFNSDEMEKIINQDDKNPEILRYDDNSKDSFEWMFSVDTNTDSVLHVSTGQQELQHQLQQQFLRTGEFKYAIK